MTFLTPMNLLSVSDITSNPIFHHLANQYVDIFQDLIETDWITIEHEIP